MTAKKTETTSLATYDSGLDKDQHNALAVSYNDVTADLKTALANAKAITVTDAADVASMKKAREARLALRKIRIDVEKKRKGLKENALRESKAIDGMANVIKYMIEPVEINLQAMEDYAKRIEEERQFRVIAERSESLSAFDMDTSCFDLGAMTEDAFEQLRRTSEAGYTARIAEEKRETERIEAQRKAEAEAEAKRVEAERIERERIEAECVKLREKAEKAEAERKAAEAKAETARKKAEAETRKIQAKAEAERKKAQDERYARQVEDADRERKAENKARILAEQVVIEAQYEKERAQAKLAAPDADKIAAFVAEVCALHIPAVSSDDALALFADVRPALNDVVKACRAAIAAINKGGKKS